MAESDIMRLCVDIVQKAQVFVDLEVFCGGFASFNERVYGLEYEGERVWFRDAAYIQNQSLNPEYNDPVARFRDQFLVEFIGEDYHVGHSMGSRPDRRGEFLEGFLYQLSGNSDIACETIGQGGEILKFEVPLELLEAFRTKLAALLQKLSAILFITYDPELTEAG